VSLPLSREPYGAPGLSWFANLLPEGTAREAVCARLGISIGNDLELLRAMVASARAP
jgi:HipA-like protein